MLLRHHGAAARAGRGSRPRRSAPTPCGRADWRRSSRRCGRGSAASPRAPPGSRPCAAAIAARSPGSPAKARGDEDPILGHAAMAIGEAQLGRRRARGAGPCASSASASTQHVLELAAIGAGVHAQAAADRAGNAATGIRARRSRPRPAVSATLRSSAPAPAATVVALGRRSRRSRGRSRTTTPATPPSRTSRFEATPITVTGTSRGLRGEEFARDPRRRPGGTSPRPGRRRGTRSCGAERRVLGRAARAPRGRRSMRRCASQFGRHHARAPRCARPERARAPPAAPCAHCVIEPAPRQTTKSPGCARSRDQRRRARAGAVERQHVAVAARAQAATSASRSTPSIGASPAG